LTLGPPGTVAVVAALTAGGALWALRRRAAKLEAAEARGRLEREIQAAFAAGAKRAAERSQAAEALDKARSGLEAFHGELRAFLAEHRLPSELSPERAVDLWNELAALQQRAEDLQLESDRLAADELLCARAARALPRSGQAPGAGVDWARRAGLGAADPPAAAAALATLVDRVRDAQQERRRLAESLDAKHEEAARLARARAALEDSAADLLEQGGCADEMEFRR